jgi:DNA-binding MarR family transcriptional regulator
MAASPPDAAGPPRVPNRTTFLLSKLGMGTGRLFAEAMAPLGLRPPQFGVLNILDRLEGASQQAIGERLGIDPSSMVGVIDDCEKAGLAERRRDPADRRRHAVYLTPLGRTTLATARRAALRLQEEVLAPLDPAERDTLLELLERLAAEGPLRGCVPMAGPPAEAPAPARTV